MAAASVLALVAALVAGCATSRIPPPRPPGATAGRIAFIDGTEGIVTADFPTGRMVIGMDKRELWHYAPGDEIWIDSYGRPLPP